MFDLIDQHVKLDSLAAFDFDTMDTTGTINRIKTVIETTQQDHPIQAGFINPHIVD